MRGLDGASMDGRRDLAWNDQVRLSQPRRPSSTQYQMDWMNVRDPSNVVGALLAPERVREAGQQAFNQKASSSKKKSIKRGLLSNPHWYVKTNDPPMCVHMHARMHACYMVGTCCRFTYSNYKYPRPLEDPIGLKETVVLTTVRVVSPLVKLIGHHPQDHQRDGKHYSRYKLKKLLNVLPKCSFVRSFSRFFFWSAIHLFSHSFIE